MHTSKTKTLKGAAPLRPTDEGAEQPVGPIEALEELLQSGFRPERLDQLYDTLQLIGMVVGRVALLKTAADPHADSRAKVSAARALTAIKEDPKDLIIRLRSSSLADLHVKELERIVEMLEVTSGEDDLRSIIQRVKEERDHVSGK